MRRLVLASTSPFRQELLTRLGLPFQTSGPHVEESRHPGESAHEMVMRLSEAKARAVAMRFPDSLIIGSDQCAVRDGEILGKPGNRERAIEQLRAASGRTVVFHTGLCLYDSGNGDVRTADITTTVHFRDLNLRQIEAYVDREQPFGCAGSFKSEGLGIALFERLEEEDPSALIGLPLIRLTGMLAETGIDVLTTTAPRAVS